MTERDAFGNPIEESRTASRPLTDGDTWHGSAAEPAVGAEPEATPAISTTEEASSEDVAPRRTPPTVRGGRRAFGCLIGLLLGLAPLLIGGWIVYRAFDNAVTPTIDVFKDMQEAEREQADAGRRATSDPPPRGLRSGSLLRPAGVASVLREARADPGGKLLLLRLAPDRADLQLGRRGGGLRIVQLRSDGSRTLLSATSYGGRGRKSIAFSKIDAGAPSRLVRAAARRLGRKTTSIDYLVLFTILDEPRWSAYFKGGAAFQGDAHGTIVRRIQ